MTTDAAAQQDYVVLTMTPPDPKQCPFRDLRLIIPVRLTTDIWSEQENGVTVHSLPHGSRGVYSDTNSSIPSEPDDYVEALPQLPAGGRAR
jgi:hypothetical protein